MNRPVLFALIGPAALFVLLHALPAAAAEPVCQFNDQFQKLEAVLRDQTLGYSESLRAQVAIRKDILHVAIACSERDLAEIKEKLLSLQPTLGEPQRLRDQLISVADEASRYLETQASRVDDVGLRGSQDLAAELGAWRTNNLKTLAGETNGLAAWLKNQDLFKIAHVRLGDITRTMQRLKLNDNDDLQALLTDAEANLALAEAENTRALEVLVRHAPADEALVPLKSSLETLSKTYKGFFDISDAVKKILPH